MRLDGLLDGSDYRSVSVAPIIDDALVNGWSRATTRDDPTLFRYGTGLATGYLVSSTMFPVDEPLLRSSSILEHVEPTSTEISHTAGDFLDLPASPAWDASDPGSLLTVSPPAGMDVILVRSVFAFADGETEDWLFMGAPDRDTVRLPGLPESFEIPRQGRGFAAIQSAFQNRSGIREVDRPRTVRRVDRIETDAARDETFATAESPVHDSSPGRQLPDR